LGDPDKFFGDRSQSEWLSFTITTDSRYLLDQIARITQQEPGNALNTWIDSQALLPIVVHHQPHYTAQKPNEGVLWVYCLYPRREGDFVRKPFIEMTGKEMLEETLGHLAAVDPAADNIADHTQEIMASVVNVVPAHMPYASALFNRRAVGDRPRSCGRARGIWPSSASSPRCRSTWCSPSSTRCAARRSRSITSWASRRAG
jgi:oleate hydratase